MNVGLVIGVLMTTDNNALVRKPAGYYSPDGDSTRTDCSTVSTPSDAMADITSGPLVKPYDKAREAAFPRWR